MPPGRNMSSSGRRKLCVQVVALVVLGLSVASCGRPLHDFSARTVASEPRPGVAVTAVLKDLVDKSDIIRGMTFLRFDYTLENRSEAPVLFSVAEVRLRAGGVMSIDSWYDAPWDSTRHWDTIQVQQKRSYALYGVFTDPVPLETEPGVEIVVPGIK
jgi:hypothetical protein